MPVSGEHSARAQIIMLCQIEKEMVSSEEEGEDGGILLDDNEKRPGVTSERE
jgi:hypothetical protein